MQTGTQCITSSAHIVCAILLKCLSLLPCLSYCQTEKKNDLHLERKSSRGRDGRGINYTTLKKALNEIAAGAKGAAYSTNSCQLHNEHC